MCVADVSCSRRRCFILMEQHVRAGQCFGAAHHLFVLRMPVARYDGGRDVWHALTPLLRSFWRTADLCLIMPCLHVTIGPMRDHCTLCGLVLREYTDQGKQQVTGIRQAGED